MQIGETPPAKVKTDSLAKEQAIIHKIEGEGHLKKILDILKKRYISYELLVGISPGVSMSEGPSTRSHHAERASSPTPSVAASCALYGHECCQSVRPVRRSIRSRNPTQTRKQNCPDGPVLSGGTIGISLQSAEFSLGSRQVSVRSRFPELATLVSLQRVALMSAKTLRQFRRFFHRL
jgi:hypothetical protein